MRLNVFPCFSSRINRLGRPTDSNVMTEFVSLPPITSSQRRRSSLSLDQRHLEMARRNNYREHQRHQTQDGLPCKNNNECPDSLSSGWRGRSQLKSWKRSLSASARRCCSPRMDSITSKTSTNDYEQDEGMTNAMGMSVRKENGHISISCVGDGILQTDRLGSSTRRKTMPNKGQDQREVKGQLDRPLSRDQSVRSRCSATSEVITTSDVLYLRRSGNGSRRGIQSQNQSPSSSMSSRPVDAIHPPPPPPPPPPLSLANRTLETSFGCSTSLSSTTTSNLSPMTQENHLEDNEEERASLLSNAETGLPRLMNSHLRPSCSIRSNNKFQLLTLPPELSCLMPGNPQFSSSNSLCSSGSSVTTLNTNQLQPPLIVPSLAASASALLLSSTNQAHQLQNHHVHHPRHHHHQQQQQLQEHPSSQTNTVLRSNLGENVVNHHLNHRLHRRRVQTINERRRRFEDNLAAIFMGFVLVFLVCHFPRLLLNIHELITIREAMECTNLGEHGFSLWSLILISISHFLLVLNSSTNILIYCLLSSKFREECSALFRKISRRVPSRPANVLM
ncbi:hypothetical protein TCAL_14299 [Tigriopus californicus]|uniref:G-protein coupled receptors family 1 profile domain-containing protein n=1 Tax=Tigriopus californicus TaxID=6832 RepID=A0A553NEQ5_TIGCA|nr:hypothetical protein TCAL_14299 [Tigriopus californicus]